MATKKNATKNSKRAEVNIPAILNSKKTSKSTKKTNKNLQKNLKNTSLKAIAISLVFMLVGVLIGSGVWYLICRNDCFILIGNDEITLTLNERYEEQGVKIVSFGKDDSHNFTIETNLMQDGNGKFYAPEEGTYYIKYKTANVKYSTLFTIEKIRLITFVEPSEQEEIDNANQE